MSVNKPKKMLSAHSAQHVYYLQLGLHLTLQQLVLWVTHCGRVAHQRFLGHAVPQQVAVLEHVRGARFDVVLAGHHQLVGHLPRRCRKMRAQSLFKNFVFRFFFIESSHNHNHHSVICVFPYNWPLGFLLSKRGHGIFNERNDLIVCCACT